MTRLSFFNRLLDVRIENLGVAAIGLKVAACEQAFAQQNHGGMAHARAELYWRQLRPASTRDDSGILLDRGIGGLNVFLRKGRKSSLKLRAGSAGIIPRRRIEGVSRMVEAQPLVGPIVSVLSARRVHTRSDDEDRRQSPSYPVHEAFPAFQSVSNIAAKPSC